MGQAGREKLEQEFSAVRSAEELGALFGEAKRRTAFVPTRTVPGTPSVHLVCLFDEWPPVPGSIGIGVNEPPSADLHRLLPTARWLALKPGRFGHSSAPPFAAAPSETLRGFEFLPDAVVFETYWRKHASPAHRLEGWRGEIGGGYEPEEILLACRRALYLQQTLPAAVVPRHLHAVGRSALLCAWLLRRLEAVESASFLLLPPPGGGAGLAGSTLRKLAPLFSGGWIAEEKKLAASCGQNFEGGRFNHQAWVQALKRWSASSVEIKAASD